LEAFTQATKANSNYYQAWLNQGALLHQMERFQEAIASYEKARRISSQKAEVFLGIGNAWYRLGDNYQAINSYQQAIQRQKDNPETWKSLGNSLFKLGNTSERFKLIKNHFVIVPMTEKCRHKNNWQKLAGKNFSNLSKTKVPKRNQFPNFRSFSGTLSLFTWYFSAIIPVLDKTVFSSPKRQ
jgi:tetratricopeptide (TPR) repeat protein